MKNSRSARTWLTSPLLYPAVACSRPPHAPQPTLRPPTSGRVGPAAQPDPGRPFTFTQGMVTTLIRANPGQLYAYAQELDQLAEVLADIAHQIQRAAESNGCFRSAMNPKLRPIRTSLCLSLIKLSQRLQELSRYLKAKANAFQATDLASQSGIESLQSHFRTLRQITARATLDLEFFLVNEPPPPDVPEWLRDGRRPPWISERDWTNLTEAERQPGASKQRQQQHEQDAIRHAKCVGLNDGQPVTLISRRGDITQGGG